MKLDPVAEHQELSRYAAQHPRLVQGGGGNCSVKFSGRMVVKASGYFLEDVSESRGFAVVELPGGAPAPESREKVSLEAGLHRLLGTYVIHTHPVAVAALVCSAEGKQQFRAVVPDPSCIWVEYAAPGIKLYEKVAATLAAHRGATPLHRALFLQNHGLFVSSETREGCIRRHEDIVRKMEDFFGRGSLGELPALTPGRYLTPDHAVYGQLNAADLPEKQRTALGEMEAFARQALGLILRKGWQPAWLPQADVDYVLNMEEEKYRQRMWKGNK